MRAILDDAAPVEDQDPIERPHGRQAMRHHDRGAPGHQPLHRLLNQPFRFGIEARGGLVEDQDRSVGQEGAGQRDPLAFAARELDPPFTDQGRVTLGQPLASRAACSIASGVAPGRP